MTNMSDIEFENELAQALSFEPSESTDGKVHSAVVRRAWFNRRMRFLCRPTGLTAMAASLVMLFGILAVSFEKMPSANYFVDDLSLSAEDDAAIDETAQVLLDAQGLSVDDFLAPESFDGLVFD